MVIFGVLSSDTAMHVTTAWLEHWGTLAPVPELWGNWEVINTGLTIHHCKF